MRKVFMFFPKAILYFFGYLLRVLDRAFKIFWGWLRGILILLTLASTAVFIYAITQKADTLIIIGIIMGASYLLVIVADNLPGWIQNAAAWLIATARNIY